MGHPQPFHWGQSGQKSSTRHSFWYWWTGGSSGLVHLQNYPLNFPGRISCRGRFPCPSTYMFTSLVQVMNKNGSFIFETDPKVGSSRSCDICNQTSCSTYLYFMVSSITSSTRIAPRWQGALGVFLQPEGCVNRRDGEPWVSKG